MADLLGIGATALRAAQLALSTTGHNISNVNTEGYSRQRAELETLQPQPALRAYLGSGVGVSTITRSHNEFIEREVLRFSSSSEQSNTFYELSARVDNLFADSESGLNASLQRFFSSLQDLANSPASLPQREVLIAEARGLEARQQSLYNFTNNLNVEINDRLETAVGEINSLANSISRIEKNIFAARSSNASPNDLLDQRDSLLRELAGKVSINVSEQPNGSLNVFIGNGHPLVVGEHVQPITTLKNRFDASRLEIGVPGLSGTATLNTSISGGELQGLLDFRKRVLDPATDKLGLLSMGLTEVVNNQHQLGVDLNGALGSNFFNSPSFSAAASTHNTGTAAPAVSLTDVSQASADSYRLDYNAGAWQLMRQSDGATVTGAGPLVMDGFSVDVSAGVPANGDSFVIQPARSAAAQFSVAITDSRTIAAAAPIYTDLTLSNSGSMSIAQLQVSDNADLPLATPVTMTFNPDALGAGVPGFDVTGGVTTTVAYDPAVDSAGVTFNLGLAGVSFTVAGVPAAGDTLRLVDTAGGSGDNRNALALANLASTLTLEGGSSTFHDVYTGLISEVAISTSQAEIGSQVETSLLAQVDQYKGSVSGVNLDEEAANLLRFQQHYQAAAQLIATADLVFSTLLGATSRR